MRDVVIPTGVEIVSYTGGSLSFYCKNAACRVVITVTLDSFKNQWSKTGHFLCKPCFTAARGLQLKEAKIAAQKQSASTVCLKWTGKIIAYTEPTISLQMAASSLLTYNDRPSRNSVAVCRRSVAGATTESIRYSSAEERDTVLERLDAERKSNVEAVILRDLSPEDATEILSNITRIRQRENFWKLYVPVREMPEEKLPIPPYILGLWLGDGHSNTTILTNIDPELVEEWTNYGISINCKVKQTGITYKILGKGRSSPYLVGRLEEADALFEREQLGEITEDAIAENFGVSRSLIYRWKNERLKYGSLSAKYSTGNSLLWKLQELGVLNNKHIPEIYCSGSIEQRRQLLAGLLDTDGYLGSGRCYSLIQKVKCIVDAVAKVATSLGWFTHQREKTKTCTNFTNPETATKVYHEVSLSAPSRDAVDIPCRLERKQLSAILRLQPPCVFLDYK